MAKTKEQTGVVIPPAVETMIQELQTMANTGTDDRDPNQIALDIVEQILTAPSLEEASGATADLTGMLDIPLLVNLRSWVPSDIGEFGVFAVLECVDGFDLDNKKVVTCGGKNVVALVYRAQKEDRLPFRGQFRQVETKQGYKTLWLDVLPE